ncbi:PglZ domain-containing protein [Barnesiella propionica]|uniref:T9SS response regulator signal transducer PorX n=1 Tax=Barnesiella propionica TaxID=2981781 RepID=UPI0011C9CA88|nr:bifunctional response regulator/alkaline phosphatase family protein [Barnesiella propionica]MCU6768337.1 PglZ domain-containing protein [Barnesiella propionica]
MKKELILWADDEIDLLKPHILFLKQKGYEVVTVSNGRDALEKAENEHYDLIILDENMPGLSGLETLSRIKISSPDVPVIMITKSEEENIMNQAIGNKIADYLIKPVNPNQILLSIKKNLYQKEIITENANANYQQEFNQISSQINDSYSWEDWYEVYKKLIFWELELSQTDSSMDELLKMQKIEANSAFVKFIKKNYEKWLTSDNHPLMSPELFKTKVFPLLDNGEKVFFILIDNFRLDQWRMIKPLLSDYFTFEEELYFSILPTATQYARNSIFSGLMPDKIASMFPDLWVDEDEEEGKNLNEAPLIQTQLDRFRKKYSFSYNKINESSFGEKIIQNFAQIENNQLNICVLNFIDMLSHARTESKMIRELASTGAAYRSLTESWFKHSSALDLFKKIAEKDFKIILTTDHGTIHVDNPIKVIGDKNTNTNLRYKVGKNLSYNPKQVYEIKNPERYGLPSPNISSTYIFATNRDFFAYPNNYNYYVSYYKDTFQHGGISMEEMMIPLVTLTKK